MKVKCYDPEGKEFLKERVDAAECVAKLKWTMEPVDPSREIEGVKKAERDVVTNKSIVDADAKQTAGKNVVEKGSTGWGVAPPPSA